MSPQWKQRLVSAFILFNILAVLGGSSRILGTFPTTKKKMSIFLPYLVWTRQLQSWLLFVPEPRRAMRKFRFEITFRDGSNKTWMRPYPPNWSFFQRHLAYNFQKFDLASETLDEEESIRHDYSLFVMKLHWNDANPPTQIVLYRSDALLPEPTAEAPLSYDETALRWQDKMIAVYSVNGKNLE